jgi:hypothetical protein
MLMTDQCKPTESTEVAVAVQNEFVYLKMASYAETCGVCICTLRRRRGESSM